MNSSEQINELATALAKAQAVMTGALKDSNNPFFKSHYADLESVWSACRKALTDNGLSVAQYGEQVENSNSLVLVTKLIHSSGQFIEGFMPVRAKDDTAQAMGSAITYARRYGLAAMVGVYQTDDDAEAAQGRGEVKSFKTSPHHEPEYKVDVEIAGQYADAIKAHINVNNPAGLYDLHKELNSDQTMYSAVGALLNTKEKAALKDAVAKKGANAF